MQVIFLQIIMIKTKVIYLIIDAIKVIGAANLALQNSQKNQLVMILNLIFSNLRFLPHLK